MSDKITSMLYSVKPYRGKDDIGYVVGYHILDAAGARMSMLLPTLKIARHVALLMNAALVQGYAEGLDAARNRSPGQKEPLGERESSVSDSQAVDSV